ncbi:MAG: AAA family ATPase, partial [Dolichospermum sp.]
HLNIHGDNLGNVVQFMEREHPEKFQSILEKIANKIPGVNKISTYPSPDGRLLLRFNDKGFQDPFYSQQMSDGTLKVFAYLLMLEDPSPPPFLCIEEPYPGGCQKLSKLPYQVIGKEKTTWAEKISPLMDIDNNQSPSFCYFRDQLRRLSEQ